MEVSFTSGRVKPSVASPEERSYSFNETVGTYTLQEAMAEASRCLFCYDAPCQKNCPTGIDIPTFIGRIRTGDLEGAIDVIRDGNVFAGVCGRVCPVEELCEKDCVMKKLTDPIAIGTLQRFVADCTTGKVKPEISRMAQKKKVAIVGAGPAGLAAAAELLHRGYKVAIFEKKPIAGGLLNHGIPTYRLPKRTSETEIHYVERMGAKIHTKKPIKKVAALLEKFDAVFVATGVCKCAPLQVPGNKLKGVFYGTDLLESIASNKLPSMKGKDVCVIGGGEVAVDSARSAKRLGAKSVCVVYRRSIDEMPASKMQVQQAKEEGVEIFYLAGPTKILGKNGKVVGCEFVRMKLGKPDKTGRRRPVPILDSKFKLDADILISAIGQMTDEEFIKDNPEIRFSNGLIVVDERTGTTTHPRIFAGGDIVNGGVTVVQAVAEGKKAACGIHQYLSREK